MFFFKLFIFLIQIFDYNLGSSENLLTLRGNQNAKNLKLGESIVTKKSSGSRFPDGKVIFMRPGKRLDYSYWFFEIISWEVHNQKSYKNTILVWKFVWNIWLITSSYMRYHICLFLEIEVKTKTQLSFL